MVTFYERKELENRIGRSVSEKEYMGIFEDFIASKDSLEVFMKEYPFGSGDRQTKINE